LHTHDILSIASAIVPERAAITFDDRITTFGELAARANRLANALAERGVEAGDRVAVIDVNTPRHLELYFAAARLDAIYMPLNFRDRAEELRFPLEHTTPKVVMVGPRYVPLIEELRPDAVSTDLLLVSEGAAPTGWQTYDDVLMTGAEDEFRFPEGEPENTAVLLFTAGTTGRPKAVMLSHLSFTEFMLTNVEPPDPDSEERTILSLPMHHIAGLQAALASVFGGRSIVMQRQFEASDWMNLVARHSVSRALVVPTMLKQVLDHTEFGTHDLGSIRVITYGGASMPPTLIERAIFALPGVQFINAFGQTETGSTIAMVPPEDHVLKGDPELVARRRRHLASIGKPLEGVEVRVVDDGGEDVGFETTGEIVARGPRLMKGYWEQADATAETIRDGWLYTGDLGHMDEDGYVYLEGRAKDFIKRGGEMVAPEEVENVIHGYDGVAECAVIGLPDETWGERVVAVVVAEPGARVTEGAVKAVCQEHLARFKRPEQVILVDVLPRNALGKVLKRELRDRYGAAAN
jgi:acyl-CoA synthetase (AMP-forming)/AMP-acid ligase II